MKQLNNEQITKAISMLKNNEVIIIPTDTIYGLSAIFSNKNEKKINKIKDADSSKPLIVLISDFDQLKDKLIYEQSDLNILNSNEPTTVIFKYLSSDKTIALRIVKRDDIKKIIDKVGPIFSTSVNKHGNVPINDKETLINFLSKDKLFYTEDLKSEPSRIYSTVKKEYIR